MKRTVLIALVVVGFLVSIGGTLFLRGPDVVSAGSDIITFPATFNLEPPNQLTETVFVYQEKMADGTLWQAYGKGRAILAPNEGDTIALTNAKGEVFQAKVVHVFTVPAGSIARGETWIEFENLTLVNGQPATGPAVAFSFWRF